MTITEIYTKYQINPTLQQHMFRVAGVADLICEHFSAPLEREEILLTCLLHDMGNIIKFKFEVFPEFFEPEGVEYWQDMQKQFIEKYGDNAHKATIEIVEEIGVPQRIVDLINGMGFSLAKKVRDCNDFSQKICLYADMRVNPQGVVSLEERFADGQVRYFRKEEDKRFAYAMNACIKTVEKQIFEKCEGLKAEEISESRITQSFGDVVL